MHGCCVGEYGAVSDQQVERLDVAGPRCRLQDAARVRNEVSAADVADTWADTWAEVGVCA